MKRLFLFLLVILAFRSAVQAETDDPVTASVPLSSGWSMPLYGIDVSSLTSVQAENAVYFALKEGFRLINTAGSFGNEEAVGRGIRKAIEEQIVSREDIFVSVGIWVEESDDLSDSAKSAVERSLQQTGLDYVDLMVVNQGAYEVDLAAYQAMEQAAEEGKVHSLGLSGFSDSRNFDLVMGQINVPPAVLLTETHPYVQNIDLRRHIAESGTLLAAIDPLGGKDDRAVLFADPAVSVPATWYRKTSDQIILRWQLQNGNITIPSVSDELSIDEFFHIFDFELTEEEMRQIDSLDRSVNFVYY